MANNFKMQKLVFFGMGADLLDVYYAVREINAIKPTYEVLGYLGPNEVAENLSGGLKYLGAVLLAKSMPEDIHFYAMMSYMNDNSQAEKRFKELGIQHDRYETIIHPRAYVSQLSTVGYGTCIMEGSVVPPSVTIGNHAIILRGVTLSHDNEIGDHSCIACGVTMSGCVRLEKFCWIGTGAVIVDGAIVGEGSLIGCGTVIRHDVPPYEVWVGNPGRFLRKVKREL